MRKRKWLLIVVLILVLINIIFWSISYFFDINAYVKRILTERIGKNLQAEITFSKLDITSKILQISDLEIIQNDGTFTFRAKQLYIQFSFWKFMYNRLNFTKSLKEIRCFSPELVYNLGHKDIETMETIDVNEIEKALRRFNYISIINGKIQIAGVGNLRFDQKLEILNLSIEKGQNNEWNLSATANQTNSDGIINFEGKYSRQSNNFSLRIDDYQVGNVEWNNGNIESARLYADIEGNLEHITHGVIKIEDATSEVFEEKISTPLISLKIAKDTLSCNDDAHIYWRGNVLTCKGKINNYTSNQPETEVTISCDNFDLKKISNELNGIMSSKITITQLFPSPVFDISMNSDSLQYKNQIFKSFAAFLHYDNNKLNIEEVVCFINNNKLSSKGLIFFDKNNINNSDLKLNVISQDFIWSHKNIQISGDVDINLNGNLQSPKYTFHIADLVYEDTIFQMSNLSLDVSLYRNNITGSLQNPSRSFIIRGNAESFTNQPKVNLELLANDLSFATILKEKPGYLLNLEPNMQAHIKFNYEKQKLDTEGYLAFPDYLNSSLHGNIDIFSNISFSHNIEQGFFSVQADSFFINNEPFQFDIQTYLDKDKQHMNLLLKDMLELSITRFHIGQERTQYKGFARIDSFDVSKVNALYPLFENKETLKGLMHGILSFDTTQQSLLKGKIAIDKLGFSKQINPVDVAIEVSADSELVYLDKLQIDNSQDLLLGEGIVQYKKGLVEISAIGENILLEDCMNNSPIRGTAQYQILLQGNLSDPTILCDFSIKNGRIFKTKFDAFDAQLFQDKEMIYLNELDIASKNYSLKGSGSYSYNFLSEKFYNIQDGLSFKFDGDFFKELAHYIPDMKHASSATSLDVMITTDETTTIIDTAQISITSGQFSIKGQQEKIKDFSLKGSVSNNILTSLNGSFRMGDGWLFFDNEIRDNDSDIYFGQIHIGTLQIWNDDKGITVHIPKYQHERAMVNARVEGFNDTYFTMYHKDGAWVLEGKVLLSNGNGIYQKPDDEDAYETRDIGLPPIHVNIDLIFEKNIWFVASPLYLKIDNGNFMSFRTDPQTEKIQLYFDIHSSKGDMRLFGEIFSAKDISFRKARTDPKVIIDGEFIKKTPDGSTIYLYVQSTENSLDADDIGTDAYGDVKVIPKSDNPNDETMLSILSKLQYGKEIDELSIEERSNLEREQAINIASDKLSDMIFSPLITPVEIALRQFFGLDFVRIRPGIIRNIIETSGIIASDEYIFDSEFESDIKLIEQLSKDILLDELAIDLGKYITPDWYLNYEALIKKEMTPLKEVSIGIQHEFSLTWDLPYDTRFIYKYQFNPAQKQDKQTISLEKVFRF